MGMVTTHEQARLRPDLLSRSQESRDFEEFWRRLRGGNIVPARSAFNLARAARFIRDLVLLEAPSPERRSLRIRLAGERYQEIAGQTLSGKDHLEFLEPEYRDGALTTGWLMATQPCGLWQITPMHLPSGYGRYIEVTGFPLGAGEDHIPLLLCHVRLTDMLLHTGDHKFSMDTATQFHFIDVGCGLPEWA
ncbi:MAG TPA: PAS domain-containing protein [Rhizomicrobium sp.]|nr:PAS domain-containing protein [Rhizomicrobium sp.]